MMIRKHQADLELERVTLKLDKCPRFLGCEIFVDYCDRCRDRENCIVRGTGIPRVPSKAREIAVEWR